MGVDEKPQEETLGSKIKNKMFLENINDEELKKLTASCCINLLNRKHAEVFTKTMPEKSFEKILLKCSENMQLFNQNLDEETETIINTIFDGIEKFQQSKLLGNNQGIFLTNFLFLHRRPAE